MNNKGTGDIVQMHRLLFTFVVCKQQNQGSLQRGPFKRCLLTGLVILLTCLQSNPLGWSSGES